MRQNDQQLGKPTRLYRDTKANIQALGLVGGDEGCTAYAIDTNEFGTFSGAAWTWGAGGSSLPAVAGAGYALVSDGVDSWVADQTPAWTGKHSFAAGIAFDGASGANEITVPDNTAIALELLDAGGLEYMRVVTINAQPTITFNKGEGDIDFQVCANGITNAIFVDGATGAVTVEGPSLAVPAAWNLVVPDNAADAFGLDDIAGLEYMRIVSTNAQPATTFNSGGGDIDLIVQAVGVADALQVQGSDGQITLGALTAGFIKSSAGGVLSVATEVALAELAGYAQGSILRGGAADWEALVHPGAAGHALISDATDIVWDQTPTWTGKHSFAAGIAFTGASGANEITVPDNTAIALELLDAGGLEYMRVVSTNANPYFLIDPAGAGINVGIGVAASLKPLHVQAVACAGGLIIDANARTVAVFESESGGRIALGAPSDGSSAINFSDEDDWNVGEILYNHATNYMAFRVNDAERVRISSAGQVKITNLAGAGVRNVVAAADGTLSAP